MSDLIPEGWAVVTLGSITNIIMGQSPLSDTYNRNRVGLPFFQGKTDFGARFPKVRVWCSEPSKVASTNAILFSVRAPVGDVNLSNALCCIGRGLAAITGTKVDQNYLYQKIQFIKPKFQLVAQGSTFEAINGSELKDFKVMVAPLPEQQKIAAILTSVDEVIEKTQAQCDKLKDLKTAMMQTLLTKGVGIDGNPHTEFKDSPVGIIPKGWDCCLLDKVARRGSGHTPDKQKPEYWNGGINWVSLTDSSKLDRLYLHNTLKKISELGVDNSSVTLHPKGTVVMTRDAGIGKSAIITSSMAVSQHFMAWICGDKLNNYFLYYLLQLWKPKFETIAMGSTIKTIGLPYFKKLQIPVPSISEQQVIANALNSVDEKIFILQRKHSSLVNTKKALMQDLLTGKVRVTVPTPSSAKAS